jgi:hypothetical protein
MWNKHPWQLKKVLGLSMRIRSLFRHAMGSNSFRGFLVSLSSTHTQDMVSNGISAFIISSTEVNDFTTFSDRFETVYSRSSIEREVIQKKRHAKIDKFSRCNWDRVCDTDWRLISNMLSEKSYSVHYSN